MKLKQLFLMLVLSSVSCAYATVYIALDLSDVVCLENERDVIKNELSVIIENLKDSKLLKLNRLQKSTNKKAYKKKIRELKVWEKLACDFEDTEFQMIPLFKVQEYVDAQLIVKIIDSLLKKKQYGPEYNITTQKSLTVLTKEDTLLLSKKVKINNYAVLIRFLVAIEKVREDILFHWKFNCRKPLLSVAIIRGKADSEKSAYIVKELIEKNNSNKKSFERKTLKGSVMPARLMVMEKETAPDGSKKYTVIKKYGKKRAVCKKEKKLSVFKSMKRKKIKKEPALVRTGSVNLLTEIEKACEAQGAFNRKHFLMKKNKLKIVVATRDRLVNGCKHSPTTCCRCRCRKTLIQKAF